MKTDKDIKYIDNYYNETIIPKGTKLVPANNLPNGGWWACDWRGMTERQKSWSRNYGFLITD
jgi:hypothetical protein